MNGQEGSGACGSPEFRGEELASFVLKAGCIRGDLFHWIHQKIRNVGDTGIRLLVEPVAVVLYANVQLPSIDAQCHEVRFVIVEEFATGGFVSLAGPQVEIVVAIKM